MKKTSGLTFRILFIVLLGGGAIVFGLSAYGYIGFYRFSDRVASDSARQAAEAISVRFEAAFRPIARRAEGFAKYEGLSSQWVLYSQSVESRKLYEHLEEVLAESPYLSSIGLLLDPATWNRTRVEVTHAPFAVRSGDAYFVRDLAESGVDYLDSAAFTQVTAEKRPVWVEPLIAENGGANPAASYAYPLEHGVLMCDVSPEWVASIAQGVGAPLGGTLRILSAQGREIFALANGIAGGDKETVYSVDLAQTGWRLEIVHPAAEIGGEAREVALKMFGIGAVALLCTAFLASLVTTSVSRSLKNLKKNISVLSDVTADIALPQAGVAGVEIVDLAESMESIHLNLAKRMADAERTLVLREGERKEIEIANDLRKKYFAPPALDEPRFSVATKLDCSNRLRGIFYDIVPTDRGTVYLAAGEVGGEGVSSVLSICALLSFLRAALCAGPKPNGAMAQLGALLAKYDAEERDVSMLLAEFYPSTGTCVLSSANYPNAMAVRGGEAVAIDLPESGNVDAGESDYASVIFNMNKGDAILFYSANLVDGNGKPLSRERLSECAANAVKEEASCRDALESLVREISGGGETRAVTSDDVLMLLQYK